MNINQTLANHHLDALPLRSWFEQRHASPSKKYNPRWGLAYKWSGPEEQCPIPSNMRLRAVTLDGFQCCALVTEAFAMTDSDVLDEDLRTFVFLLNPADGQTWEAISSWFEAGLIVLTGDGGANGGGTHAEDRAICDLERQRGEELESDLLAGALLKLLSAKRLEQTLASQLETAYPLYVSIAETPMMCKSIQPVDPKLWRQHLEHKTNIEKAMERGEAPHA
jgi:hypothetical protein